MEVDNREKQMTRRMKLVTSVAIWFCSTTFGLAVNFLSPLLVELKNKYNTSISDISTVLTIILLCYLVGALTWGLLFNYVNRQLTIVILLYTMAVGIMVIPYCPTKVTFFLDGGIIGFCTGGVDTGMLVWMLELWQGEAGVYVHTHYFFFAVGTVIAPLLIKPFLLEEDSDSSTTISSTEIFSTSTTDYANMKNGTDESQLHIPLYIGGSIITLAASFVLFLFFYDKYVPPPPRQDLDFNRNPIENDAGRMEESVDAVHDNQNVSSQKKIDWNKILLIFLSAVSLGCYQGMELSTFQFFPTFTHYVDLKLSEPDGASVLAALNGAYTAGRFGGIFITRLKLAPFMILLGNLTIIVTANVLLLVFANTNLTMLWVGAVLVGLGFSTVFACIYDHVEKHLEITNNVGATMVIAGGLVSALYPLILGDMVDQHPFILMYTIFFSVGACTTSFSFIYWITVIRKRHVVSN